jgi:hypothetical protein
VRVLRYAINAGWVPVRNGGYIIYIHAGSLVGGRSQKGGCLKARDKHSA